MRQPWKAVVPVLIVILGGGSAAATRAAVGATKDPREQLTLLSHRQRVVAAVDASYFRSAEPGRFDCSIPRETPRGRRLLVHSGGNLTIRSRATAAALDALLAQSYWPRTREIRAKALNPARTRWRLPLPHDLRAADRLRLEVRYADGSFVELQVAFREHRHPNRRGTSPPRADSSRPPSAVAGLYHRNDDIRCTGCGDLDHYPGLGCAREVSPGVLEVRLPGGGTFLTHKGGDVFPPDQGGLLGFAARLVPERRVVGLATTLTRPGAFGISVDRVVGVGSRKDCHAKPLSTQRRCARLGRSKTRLIRVGTVLFGRRRLGRLRLAWQLRVGGKPLRVGKYRITPRMGYGPYRVSYNRDRRTIVIPPVSRR